MIALELYLKFFTINKYLFQFLVIDNLLHHICIYLQTNLNTWYFRVIRIGDLNFIDGHQTVFKLKSPYLLQKSSVNIAVWVLVDRKVQMVLDPLKKVVPFMRFFF